MCSLYNVHVIMTNIGKFVVSLLKINSEANPPLVLYSKAKKV